MKLVITEKPSVAKSVADVIGATKRNKDCFAGGGYLVSWCFGHLYTLAEPKAYKSEWAAWDYSALPILPHPFKLAKAKGKSERIKELTALMKSPDVDELIEATDAGREGELIFRYLYEASGIKKPVKRLWVSSLTNDAIKAGFENLKPLAEYDLLSESAKCRAQADWLVGFNASRIFGIKFGLKAAGRVQSPTLAMIVKRQNEIDNFTARDYFTVKIDLGNGFFAESGEIKTTDEASGLAASLKNKTATVTDVRRQDKTSKAPLLYDLTALQRDANVRYGYSAKKTLDIAQSLYEAKRLTYPRTDSRFITDDMERTVASLLPLCEQITKIKAPGQTDVTKTINNAGVSDHHAILITSEAAKGFDALGNEEKNIIFLVAARMLSAVLPDKKESVLKVTLGAESEDFFAQSISPVNTDSFAAFEKLCFPLKATSAAENAIPANIETGRSFLIKSAESKKHQTKPPAPYTEATLLAAMENAGKSDFDKEAERKGLGTPATRAAIIEGLISHGYIRRKAKQLLPTDDGIKLVSVLPTELRDAALTVDWENKLLQIQKGGYSSGDFLNEVAQMVNKMTNDYSNKPNYEKKEKATGTWFGKEISFNRVWGGHRFTDDEVSGLLEGESIIIAAESKKQPGTKYEVRGSLKEQNYNGRDFVGFSPSAVPVTWCGHAFTEDEAAALESGETIELENVTFKNGNSGNVKILLGIKPNGYKGIVFANRKE